MKSISFRPFIICGLAAIVAGCANPGWDAIREGDTATLQEVLNSPGHGNTSLDDLMFRAAQTGCFKCAQMVLAAGAKPNYEFLAAAEGHERVARLLFNHGGTRNGGRDPLRYWGITSDQRRSANAMLDEFEREREAQPVVVDNAPAVPMAAPEAPLAPGFQAAEKPSDYALIIGVEKYDSLPSATYAEGDAATAANFVRALGVPARNVVTLTGSHATRSSMVKQLENWLAKNTDETSTVYFYFSGHGAPDPTTGEAYLVPFDGDPQYLAETAYPLKRLYAKLEALKAKRSIVMLDSCFSGAGGRSVLAKGARPLVLNLDTGMDAMGGNIAVLTASGANQISGVNDEKRHGLFTYYLFNGLNGAAADGSGHVTLQSLYSYLKPKVMDDARRANRDQAPELKADPSLSSAVLRDK